MSLTKMNRGNSPAPNVTSENTKTGLPSILYVEDEDVNWEIVRIHLGKTYKLTRASNSKQVFRILSNSTFDLILMDIQLAGSDFNGIEIVQCLRGNRVESQHFKATPSTKTTPVIFLTAYPYTKEDVQDIGGNNVIHKPVDLRDLSQLIGLYLNPEYASQLTPPKTGEVSIEEAEETTPATQVESPAPNLPSDSVSSIPDVPPEPVSSNPKVVTYPNEPELVEPELSESELSNLTTNQTKAASKRSFGRFSIAYKLLPFFILGSLASLFWITNISQSHLKNAEKEKLRISTKAAKTSVENLFQRANLALKTIARFPEALVAIEANDPERFAKSADELLKANPAFFAALIVNSDKVVVAANSTNAQDVDVADLIIGKKIPALSTPLQLSMRKDRPRELFIRPFSSPDLTASGKPEELVGFMAPILKTSGQKPAGAVVLLVSSSNIETQFLSTYLADDRKKIEEAIYLISPQNQVWSTVSSIKSDIPFENIAKKISELSYEKHTTERFSVSHGSHSFYGSSTKMMLSTLAKKEWTFVHIRSDQVLDTAVSVMKKQLHFGLVITFIFTFLALMLIIKRSLAPLLLLASHTDGVTRAQDFAPLPIKTTDEVGALSQVINRAFETLGDYEIGLEQKVELRSHRLEKALKELKDAKEKDNPTEPKSN